MDYLLKTTAESIGNNRGLPDRKVHRFGSANSKNLKIVCASPIHQLCATDVGKNRRIISAVADIRRVTTGSTNQPRVEAYQKKGIG
jgi:hypothetical protein